MSSAIDDPLEAIPPTKTVRDRLAENVREGRLLRQMLRLAEKADKERRRQTEGRDDAS